MEETQISKESVSVQNTEIDTFIYHGVYTLYIGENEMSPKAIINGAHLTDEALSEKNKLAYLENALKNTVVVKKELLIKICEQWNSASGEVTLSEFLLGTRENTFLRIAVEEVEERLE